MSLWSALPIELKRLILELVARDDLNDARWLRLVSHDINVLVLPIIFQNVLIESIPDLLGVTRTIAPPPTALHRLRDRILDPPRLLSTYNTISLALLLPENLPSIENALARVGAVFSRIRYLAITSRNLSSNAFWLRENHVRPTRIMLLHHGSPRPVNWRDEIFRDTTHIFTSSIDSHGRSTLSDLSNLTHLAISTHSELPDDKIRCISRKLEWLLDPDTLPNLESFVLGIQQFPRPPPERVCGHIIIDVSARERYTYLLTRWRTHLQVCLTQSKFYVLPDPLYPREEWEHWINSDPPDIWQRAMSFREKYPNSMVFEPRPAEGHYLADYWLNMIEIDFLQTDEDDPPLTPQKQNSHSRLFSKVDWEIDLVQREGYRESERLDPGEAGEFVHSLGF
ncbi:hypothetical protein D9756_006830 [Leucocoprinus leucothites]|uniref:Uncharacterized protein n=1 Tax=Leucocoprinus leucothites TaxID=201217 RepID=A0A8H5G2D2_9AGAR|nr:hypothetical protein D9756_006830 [Leucoagaricus leucothites]